MRVLEVRRVTKRFGSLVALNDVEFVLTEHEILGIIGPNGAGKSTLFNVIAGLDTPSAGDVVYRGRSIAGLKPDAVCRLGIAKTFQIPQLFPRMTVSENVLVAAASKRVQEPRVDVVTSPGSSGPPRTKRTVHRPSMARGSPAGTT